MFFPANIFKHILALPSGVVFLYAGAYLMLRFLYSETEEGTVYLNFPSEKPALYWVFKPASYCDEYLTGAKSRLRPE